MLGSTEITIEVTNRCSANCVTCPRESFTQKLAHMDMDLFKKIIDDAAANGIDSLDTCGFGDPLLDPLLQERFEYIKANHRNMLVYCSTTCNMLTDGMVEWFGRLVDTVKISCFATSKEVYKRVHGLPTYDKSLRNILQLVEYKAKHGKPYLIGLFLKVSENQHQMEEWKAFWEPKFDEIMVWKPHNWVNAREYRKKSKKRRSCGRPKNGNITVGVDGRVSICCFDYNKTVTIGDLNTQTIAEVRKSHVLKNIVEMHENVAFEENSYLCRDCDQTFKDYDDVLIYSSNKERKPGMVTSHINKYNDMLMQKQ